MKPIPIRGGVFVLGKIVKGEEAAPAMIEYAVEDDSNPRRVPPLEQTVKRWEIAQLGIDLEIIARLVAMIRGGIEDRVEVDGVDSEIEQVVELLDHAFEIAAHEPAQFR